jgi:hypothetical protein
LVMPRSGQNGFRRFVSLTLRPPARISTVSTPSGTSGVVCVWRAGITRGYNARMSAGNRRSVVLIALVFTVSVLVADVPRPVEQEVLAADLQRLEAMTSGDATKLATLLAAEAIYINNQAQIDDKQSILFAIEAKSTIYQSIIATERKARVIGGMAIVTGVAAIRGVERKEKVDLTVRYMAVYARRDGRWQMTAGQSTKLVPSKTVISGQPA